MNYKELCEDLLSTLETTLEEFQNNSIEDPNKTYESYEIIELLKSIIDIQHEY